MGSTVWAAASAVLCECVMPQDSASFALTHIQVQVPKHGCGHQSRTRPLPYERLVLYRMLGVLSPTMQVQYGCLTTYNGGLMYSLGLYSDPGGAVRTAVHSGGHRVWKENATTAANLLWGPMIGGMSCYTTKIYSFIVIRPGFARWNSRVGLLTFLAKGAVCGGSRGLSITFFSY